MLSRGGDRSSQHHALLVAARLVVTSNNKYWGHGRYSRWWWWSPCCARVRSYRPARRPPSERATHHDHQEPAQNLRKTAKNTGTGVPATAAPSTKQPPSTNEDDTHQIATVPVPASRQQAAAIINFFGRSEVTHSRRRALNSSNKSISSINHDCLINVCQFVRSASFTRSTVVSGPPGFCYHFHFLLGGVQYYCTVLQPQ